MSFETGEIQLLLDAHRDALSTLRVAVFYRMRPTSLTQVHSRHWEQFDHLFAEMCVLDLVEDDIMLTRYKEDERKRFVRMSLNTIYRPNFVVIQSMCLATPSSSQLKLIMRWLFDTCSITLRKSKSSLAQLLVRDSSCSCVKCYVIVMSFPVWCGSWAWRTIRWTERQKDRKTYVPLERRLQKQYILNSDVLSCKLQVTMTRVHSCWICLYASPSRKKRYNAHLRLKIKSATPLLLL